MQLTLKPMAIPPRWMIFAISELLPTIEGNKTGQLKELLSTGQRSNPEVP
jgi:hypothetical protein